MSLNDLVSIALSHILNCERGAKSKCTIQPISKLLIKILDILKEEKYIKNYKILEKKKGGIIEIELSGRINNCGAVKPRFPVEKIEFEKFEKRYLPAAGFGILIVSTSKGIMDHKKAIESGIGGRLLAYCY